MKQPTQFDVAKRAGVSRTTVSFVLNGVRSERVPISKETRVRVLEAIEELGYVPNAMLALRSGDTKTLSLIMPDFSQSPLLGNGWRPRTIMARWNSCAGRGERRLTRTAATTQAYCGSSWV